MKLTELQEKWLQELESGRRKQCTKAMCRRDSEGEFSFCCLGVAREVMGTRGGNFYLDEEEASSLGLFSNTGRFKNMAMVEEKGERFIGLAEMNDSGLFTFQEIAAFIRKNPELVFNNGDESC